MDSDPAREIDEENLEDLYSWVDQIPLTRPKKNIARDFSDGCKLIFQQNNLNYTIRFFFTIPSVYIRIMQTPMLK